MAAALAGAGLAVGLLTKFLDLAVFLPLLVVLAVRGEWRRLLPAAAGGGALAAALLLLPLHDAWSAAMYRQAVGCTSTASRRGPGSPLATRCHCAGTSG